MKLLPRSICAFVCLVAFVTGSAGYEPDYGIDIWQTDRGLPQNAANALAQTDDGFLWMATWNGLARIDGTHVVSYRPDSYPQMPSARLRSVWATGNRIWLSNGRKGLVAMRGEEWVEYAFGDSSGSATDLVGDAIGGIWVARGDAGLAYLAPGSDTFVNWEAGLARCDGLAVDSEGMLWVASAAGKIERIDPGQKIGVKEWSVSTTGIVDLAADMKGGLWVLEREGVYFWDEEDGKSEALATFSDQGDGLAIVAGVAGECWVGTRLHGIWQVRRDGRMREWAAEDGLPSNAVISVLRDREGSVWAGLDNAGLAHLTPAPFTEFGAGEWGRVQSIAIKGDGTVLLASLQAGLIQIYPDGSTTIGGGYPLDTSLISVAVGRDGAVWLGGFDGTVHESRDGKWTQHPLFVGGRDSRVYHLFVDSRGDLWATSYAGLARWRNGEWKIWREGMKWIRNIAEAPDGAMWIRSRGRGLVRIVGDEVEDVVADQDLPKDTGFTMYFDRQGNLWMGSFGSGVDLWREGKLSTLRESDGLPDDMAMSFADDVAGNLWVGSARGVFRAKIEDLVAVAERRKKRVEGLSYARADGLDQLEFPGGFGPLSAVAPDGSIWMVTLSGAIRLNPAVTNGDGVLAQSSPVVITNVSLDHQLVPGPEEVRIEPKVRRLDLRFAVVGLRSPEKTRLRYRLRGFDEDWTEVSGVGEASYTRLPPGNFVFEVLGRNGLGVWGEQPLQLAVTVVPAWWQTWWWRGLFGLGGVIISWQVGRVYSHRVMRRKLERAEREQALTKERERIAHDIHDILGANLARLRHLGVKVKGKLSRDDSHNRPSEELDRVSALCDESLDNLRELVWTCDPRCDTLQSTVDFLEQQIGEVARECELVPSFEVDHELPHMVLVSRQRHALLLLFREALANVVKHAKASRVFFNCAVVGTEVRFVLGDDGAGFDAENIRPGGNGLGNMPQRAVMAGVHYELHSEVGKGTRVEVVLTLEC